MHQIIVSLSHKTLCHLQLINEASNPEIMSEGAEVPLKLIVCLILCQHNL